MNRIIKFRRALFLNGVFSHFKYWGKDLEGAIFVSPGPGSGYEVKEDQQFTGLLDNYHKEIYDGDLLKSGQGNIFKVLWDDNEAGWVLDCLTGDNKGPCELKKYMEENLEAIGNIFENADLIK